MTTETKVTHTPGTWEAHAEVRLSGEEYAAVYANDAPTGYKMPAECSGPNAEANARMIAASVNSYDKHCGAKAVQCAEGDLLGEALEALERLIRDDEDGEYTIGMIEDARAVLSKAKGTNQ